MYIDAKQIYGDIWVSQRDENGLRSVSKHLPPYTFYHTDPNGRYTSITGEKLRRHRCFKKKQHEKELNAQIDRGVAIFESDVSPVYRLLEEKFPSDQGPSLNICLLDIETDKDPERGFSSTRDPYSEITAITIYNKWADTYFTLIVPPENLTPEDCRRLLDGEVYQDADGNLTPNCPDDDTFGPLTEDDGFFIVETEAELLEMTTEIIQDADVISGWNSMFYDIPYIIQRIRHVLGGESLMTLTMEVDSGMAESFNPSAESIYWLTKWNLFDCLPTPKIVPRYGSMELCFSLHGRIHLDMLELYQKFTYDEKHSYALDNILQIEVKQTKVQYEGSLDQLYRRSFRRFAAYSYQDVAGLAALDAKLKFIELANTLAHGAGVTLDKTLGSVVVVEQTILRRLHQDRNLICFDKPDIDNLPGYPIPGAYVLTPSKGFYKWICSYDYNSLYPSIIRAMNASPEVIMGFVEPTETLEILRRYMIEDNMSGAEAWSKFPGTLEYNKIINRTDDILTFTVEDTKEQIQASATDLHDLFIEQNWTITAFGLVLRRDKMGIIPHVLGLWYENRLEAKASAKKAYGKAQELEGADKDKAMDEFGYYDLLQLNLKILLNSAYGALLNAHCRFSDPRMGASTTMSGKIALGTLIDTVEDVMASDELLDVLE